MGTLFISDLHLDDSRPKITGLFLDFLKQEATQAEALYILGDFFEAWVGDDDDSELGKIVTRALRVLSDSGVPVFFMRGNRDFLIGPILRIGPACKYCPTPACLNFMAHPHC